MQDYVYDMGYAEFEGLEELRQTLAHAIAKGLFINRGKDILIDFTGGDKTYSAATLLAYSLAVSKVLKEKTKNKRIGIAMPPCAYAAIANYACIFAGKTPVNLNFTMGRAAAESCLKTADIKDVVSSEAMRKKISDANQNFPWAENFIDIAKTVSETKPFDISVGLEKILEHFRIEKFSKNEKEATLVFTSGSEGEPKAAILTERNIIANCLQTRLSNVFLEGDILLANLPVFHSFGLLFEIWALAINGVKSLLLASPIDIKTNLRAIRQYRPNVMLGSPTFYRAYIRHAEKEDMQSLRMAIAGAEKTPAGFEELWNSRFSPNSYKEGYGLTETSPVVGVNMPDVDYGWYSTGTRKGSIGKLFPGMRAKILDASTLKPLPFGERGLLALQGANVFAGYLNNPEATKNTLNGGWIVMGDLARIDKDGFLFIDGRLSRFSKIGGEMVPHATVESALSNALGFDKSDIPLIAISSKLDEGKGEALVLITTVDIDHRQVKEALKAEGISNLWTPKHIVKTDRIPLLPSGKLNLKELSKIAEQ